MNNLEKLQLVSLDEQNKFYLELYKILTNDSTKISMTDGYNFVLENKSIFEKYSILTIQSMFKEYDSKKYKEIIKLLDNKDYIQYIQAITMQLNKDNINEYTEEIKKERNKNTQKVEEILSLTKQQKIIITKAKQLEESIIELQEEIEEKKIIIKKQSDNLKENIGLIDENHQLKIKEEKLIKLGRQFNQLVKEGKKLNILIDVNNGRGEVKFNSTAIDATNNFSVTTPGSSFRLDYESGVSSNIIKEGDPRTIEKFELQEIKDSNETQELEEVSDPISVKLMIDRISELEDKEIDDKKEKIKLTKELKKERKESEKIRKKLKTQEEEIELMKKRLNEQEALLLKHKIKTHGLKITDEKKD